MIVLTPAPTEPFYAEVIYWLLPIYLRMSTDEPGLAADWVMALSPKHSQVARQGLLMQSQCCFHNIVGKCIPLSRTAEFGPKFPTDETLRRHDRKTNQYL
jgi:hypothetical protein